MNFILFYFFSHVLRKRKYVEKQTIYPFIIERSL